MCYVHVLCDMIIVYALCVFYLCVYNCVPCLVLFVYVCRCVCVCMIARYVYACLCLLCLCLSGMVILHMCIVYVYEVLLVYV